MRCSPPPDSVTLPPPSITMSGPVSLNTFAVRSSVMVTGSGPQSNVMVPPPATAATNASDVQLSGVPVPTIVVGTDVSTAPASAGTSHVPSGLPAGGPCSGSVAGGGGPSSPSAITSSPPSSSDPHAPTEQ